MLKMSNNLTTTHAPQRMCVGCRQMKDKKMLIRVVCADGVGTVDTTQKAQSRGVYFCKNPECIKRALKNKGFAKQYGFALDEQLVKQMENTFES